MAADQYVLSLLDRLQTQSRESILPSQKEVRQLQDAVTVLSSAQAPVSKGSGPNGLEAAASCIQLLVGQLLMPPAQLFSGLCGAPCEPEVPSLGALHVQAVTCKLQLLRVLLQLLGSIDLPAAAEPNSNTRQADEAQQRNRPHYVIGIVEIVEEANDDDVSSSSSSSKQTPQQQLQARLPLALLQLLLACALYAAPSSNNTSSSSSACQPGCCDLEAHCSSVQQQALGLSSPWSGQQCEQACQTLLDQAAAQVKLSAPAIATTAAAASEVAAAGSTAAAADAQHQRRQQLLGGLLLPLLDALRDTVLAQHRHRKAEERAEAGSYKGPDVYQRCLAARQLAWLCLQLQSAALDEHFGVLLPLVLAVSDDPSPSVQRYGHAMLSWLAKTCQAATLRWQDMLLTDVSRRIVVGCEESCWVTVMPAATSLVMALEGNDVRSPSYHTLLSELLTEAERSAHKPQQRLVFMACLALLLPRLGLHCVRYFARLLPLLLEWVHAYDAASAAVAVQVLARVVLHAWPRMPAHAGIIWQHLVRLMVAADGSRQKQHEASSKRQAASGLSGMLLEEALVEVVQGLKACGGESFAAAVAGTAEDHKAAIPARVAEVLL